MNFRRRRPEEPEINLIPFIDVLLVVLIFLMLSTTYAKTTQLKVVLPTADADRPPDRIREIVVSVSADGRVAVDRQMIEPGNVEALAAALRQAAAAPSDIAGEPIVVISADASSTHQSVVGVMDAARRARLARLSFATQSATGAAAGAR